MREFIDRTTPLLRKHGITAELPFPSTDIPDGWLPIVDELLGELRELGVTQVAQIKEKWGALTVYLPRDAEHEGSLEDASAAIDRAASRCAETCEQCSSAGRLRKNWVRVRVLCDGCLGKELDASSRAKKPSST